MKMWLRYLWRWFLLLGSAVCLADKTGAYFHSAHNSADQNTALMLMMLFALVGGLQWQSIVDLGRQRRKGKVQS